MIEMCFVFSSVIVEVTVTILGEKLFHTWEIPRSGSKAEDGEKEKKERLNNGQAMHGARKHAWRIQAAWAKRKKKKKSR